MNTKSAARGKLPKNFDFNSVMARTKAPKPKSVSTFLRTDLLDRIFEIEEILGSDEPEQERSIGDPDPKVDLEDELDGLKAEFNDSELVFEFRALKLSDVTKAREAMVRDGIDLTDETAAEISVSYMLASVCENAGWTGAEFHQFREQIGEAAFRPLLNAAEAPNQGPAVNAPFSLRPSPGLTSEK